MDEYQNRRDIDKIYDDLYDSINGSLNVVAFTNESKYKNISSKSDGSDRGTIDAIIDYYGLTNQYAPLIHTHTWNDIEDKPSINSYAISSDEYNPSIDSSVTITITVTDEYGETVPNHSFTLDANGTDVSLTTDDDGVATHTYTCDDWGLHTFKVGENTIQLKVTGWRRYTDDSVYKVYYNEDSVWFSFSFTGSSGTITSSWTELGANVFNDSFIRPSRSVFFIIGNVVMGQVRSDDTKFRFKSLSGNIPAPFTIEGERMWKRSD